MYVPVACLPPRFGNLYGGSAVMNVLMLRFNEHIFGRSVGLVLAGLLAAMSGGCTHKSLDSCPAVTDDLHVAFGWDAEAVALPEGMAVFFYPQQGSGYWRYDLPPEGGHVAVPRNRYDVIIYNNDTDAMLFEGTGSFATASVTTRQGNLSDGVAALYTGAEPPHSHEAADEPVRQQPNQLWVCAAANVDATHATDSITLTPAPAVATYRITVTDITNLGSVSQMSMSLSGLAAGLRFADRVPLTTAVTVPGSLSQTSPTSAVGTMLTFGSAASANHLCLYFWLRDGQKKVVDFDVSTQIASAPDPMDVAITVSGVELPEVETSPGGNPGSGSGIDVGVDNWDYVVIELSPL